MTRFRFCIWLLTACCLTIAAVLPVAAQTPQEFKVKAGYLLNIPLFSEWSASSHPGCSSFTICIMGETPLAGVLDDIRNKRINNRPVLIRTIKDMVEAECCQVLFIAASERYRLQRLLPEAHRRGIMTVSDMRDFSRAGGMVALVPANSRIGYDLNLSAAKAASISFSSQLLKLANDITR
jgi:hypothetical protein